MKRLMPAVLMALSSLSPMKLEAYPIDCAILLCLSGGWPASAPCAAAKAEFIRRITPIPVEPPLQIWRCPMGGASLEMQERARPGRDASADGRQINATPITLQTLPRRETAQALRSRLNSPHRGGFESWLPFRRVADVWADPFADRHKEAYGEKKADIDISGPEFDFVRSIRVYQTFAYQRLSGREDDECTTRSSVLLGSYGMQGAFRWSPSRLSDLPKAHAMPTGMGAHCPMIFHRSVFVDWRDFEGRYGFEQVDY